MTSDNEPFWADAEKGPLGVNQKRLTIPTYDPDGGEEKEYDWDRPAPLTLQDDLGLRIILGDPDNASSPDIAIERTPDRWRIFVHHDGGDPLCYIEITDSQTIIKVDPPGVKPLLVQKRVVG